MLTNISSRRSSVDDDTPLIDHTKNPDSAPTNKKFSLNLSFPSQALKSLKKKIKNNVPRFNVNSYKRMDNNAQALTPKEKYECLEQEFESKYEEIERKYALQYQRFVGKRNKIDVIQTRHIDKHEKLEEKYREKGLSEMSRIRITNPEIYEQLTASKISEKG